MFVVNEDYILEHGKSVSQVEADLSIPNMEYQNKARFGKGRYKIDVPKNLCFLRRQWKDFILPRYYFGENPMGIEGREIKGNFKFSLRDYQEEFFAKYRSVISNYSGVLMEASCGMGKTIMGIYLSLMRGRQTLVIVPTYYLASQWKQRIEDSTDCSVHVMQSTDTDIPTDKDFTIVVTDLFSCRILPEELVNNIGHVILDEAHRIGAPTYMPILDELHARYRTALTATFRREDGMHKILKYHFGEVMKLPSIFPKPEVYGVHTNVEVKHLIQEDRNTLDFLVSSNIPFTKSGKYTSFDANVALDALNKRKVSMLKKEWVYFEKVFKKALDLSYTAVESYLSENAKRRKTTISLIQASLEAGRCILFLSKRKATLKSLSEYFAEYKPMLIVSETNKRTEEENNYLQNECKLIFGVNQLAKEGLDIDRLDTLIIDLPIKDTEQAIGRISRLHPNKKKPMALYLVDNCPFTYAVFNKSKTFIKINGDLKGDVTVERMKDVLKK